MKKIKQTLRSHIDVMRRVNFFVLDAKVKKILLVWLPCSIAITQFPLISAYFFGQVVNKLSSQKSIFGEMSLFITTGVLIFWYLLARLIRFVNTRKESIFRREVSNKTEHQYWKASARLDLQDRENTEVQDAISDAQRNYSAVLDIFFTQWGISGSIIALATSATVLGLVEWWYVVLVIAILLPGIYLNRSRKSKTFKQQKRLNELKRYRTELSSNIGTKETIINGATHYFLSRYDSLRQKLLMMQTKLDFKFQNIAVTGDIWYWLLMGFLYYHLFNKVIDGVMPIGNLFLAFTAVNQLHENLSAILTKIVDIEDQSRRAKDFFLIVDMSPAIIDRPDAQDVAQNVAPIIEFSNVWFKYPNTEMYILKGVTFTIQSGERIGLVGENGEGKTTLAYLMLRFYEPTEGSIRINGIDLRLIKRDSLFAIAGIVFQDFNLFQARVSETIRSSSFEKTSTMNEIIQSAMMAGIHTDIDTFEQKYDQKIGRMYKGGIKLSGGQRQKISIASLLYRNPKLMILDELTSALSPTAEYNVIKEYAEVSKGKTCLFICQRYKSLEVVDRIIVLKDGVVAENGTQSELIAQKGIFNSMFEHAQLRVVS